MTLAVYAGTFDPPTNGHLDVARRAAPIFDQLVIAIYDQSPKNLLFDTQQRVEMFRDSVGDLPNVRVEPIG